jgi:hypothetical protein
MSILWWEEDSILLLQAGKLANFQQIHLVLWILLMSFATRQSSLHATRQRRRRCTIGWQYSWGAAKAIYRSYPLYSKKGNGNFLGLVSKCISQEVLTTDLIRKFSRRARNNMLTYKSLEFVGDDGGRQNMNTISHLRIENLQKCVACHRAAFDFDIGFIFTISKIGGRFGFRTRSWKWPPQEEKGKEKEFNINISLRAYLHCAVIVCPAANKNTRLWKFSVHRPRPSWLSCVLKTLFNYTGRTPPITCPRRRFRQNRT